MDLSGFEVVAVDGSIGKVDEAAHDFGESYFVVYRSAVGGYHGSHEAAEDRRGAEAERVADRD